jgi:hypothetical protein
MLMLMLLQVNKAFSERRKMMRNTLQPLYSAQQVRRICLHSLDLLKLCCALYSIVARKLLTARGAHFGVLPAVAKAMLVLMTPLPPCRFLRVGGGCADKGRGTA